MVQDGLDPPLATLAVGVGAIPWFVTLPIRWRFLASCERADAWTKAARAA